MKRIPALFVLAVLLLGADVLYGQNDSIVLNNGDVIVGEAKSMNRGVLIVETDYSDSDFKIEWEKIRYIETVSRYMITLSDGQRYSGRLTTNSSDVLIIAEDDGSMIETPINDIVFMSSIDSGFWDQFYANIDLGFSLTKANDLRSVNLNSKFGYLAEKWNANAYYSSVMSSQNDVEDIRRNDAGVGFSYYLPKDWYIPVNLVWLSNTEQKLDLRTSANVGLGNYLIHSNQVYWGISAGFNFNNETYSTEDPDRQTAEAFFGTELNMFDIGDLSLLINIVAYPSLTADGRWRTDFKFDAKYDLPKDFYIRLGYTLNYDNRPVEGASETDYVLQGSFGWEW